MTGGLGMFFTEMNDIVQQISKRRGILINHNNCGHLMPKIENIHDEFETNQSWSNVIQFSTTIYHTFASMKNVGNYSSRTKIIESERSKKYALPITSTAHQNVRDVTQF